MATFAQNTVQQLFIGGTADKTDAGAALSGANTGEICILSPDGKILSEADAADVTSFKIGLRRGADIDLVSDVIQTDKVKFVGVKTYEAPTEQVSHIGYDGTTGAIDTNDNELYYVRLYIEDLFNRSSSDGRRIKVGVYQSGVSPTQAQIATGVTLNLIKNFSRDAEKQIRFERLCSDAGDAIGAAADTVVGSKGSKAVTVTDVGANASVIAIAAGDYFRVGTATTAPVYKVVASTVGTSGGVLTLDQPLEEDVNLLGTTAEFIPAADAATANFGIKLTGVPLDFKLGKVRFKKSRWETQVDNTEGFRDTPISTPTAAKVGRGTYEILSELEWFTQGHEGEFFRMGEPLIFDARKDADPNVAGGGYDLLDIMFVDDEVVGFQANVSKKHITLAIPNTTPAYALTGTDDDITDVLEALIPIAASGSLALTN